MTNASEEIAGSWRWTSEHWWSSRYALGCEERIIASVQVKLSTGTAELGGCWYLLKRFRLPPYITIREGSSDDLVARLCLVPKRGFLAEFDDGRSFRLGWTNWLRREWSWVSESGETVLLSKHSWLGRVIEMRPGPGLEACWPILAVLELAESKLGVPVFTVCGSA